MESSIFQEYQIKLFSNKGFWSDSESISEFDILLMSNMFQLWSPFISTLSACFTFHTMFTLQKQPTEVFNKKPVLLKTSQNLQENTVSESLFSKSVFSWEFWEIFKSNCFTEHLRATLSGTFSSLLLFSSLACFVIFFTSQTIFNL